MDLARIIKIAEIIGILLGATAFALVTYWKLREKAMVKAAGLPDNPERCRDHEKRLRDIEMVATRLDEKVAHIEGDVDSILKKLEALGASR